MQTPFSVRPLLADERAPLETGLRSASAFPVRRCQRRRARAAGQVTTTMAHALRCTAPTVRTALPAFPPRGLAALQPPSSRPHTSAPICDAGTCAALRALCPQRPRTCGTPPSRWTRQLAAEVRCAPGLPPGLVSDEARRVALRRLGVTWKGAPHGLPRPAPAYARKKTARPAEPAGEAPSTAVSYTHLTLPTIYSV